jgi:hypothetical protein
MSATNITEGVSPGSLPPRYTGGLGREGLIALERFVRDGGTLICLDTAAGAIAGLFGLPLEDITSGELSAEEEEIRREFFCPGSILSLDLEPGHPLTWGMGERCAVYFSRSPVFRLKKSEDDEEDSPQATAPGRYPGTNPLLSGWISGDKFIRGQAALVDCPLGDGRMILIGFRTQHRAQTHGTYKILFNAIYYTK